MPANQHPLLYEINTMTLLNRLSKETGQEVRLKNIPNRIWTDLRKKGVDYVWMMGMWQRSEASRQVALTLPELRTEYSRMLGQWTKEDVPGSPYAVRCYEPDGRFGTMSDLKNLKKTLHEAGLKLILDFVPNHTGLDHPWVQFYPDRFFKISSEQLNSFKKEEFSNTSPGVFIAHGRDPYFPPWTDTLQLNYTAKETREAMIDVILTIAPYCDGLRCDMAMLLINRVFQSTWKGFWDGKSMPDGEFWTKAIKRVKKKFPDFIFIAEAYWDLEWKLQQMGFDYTYDKKLYDRLFHSGADDVRGHLGADQTYQNKSIRFIENHDEPRALAAMPPEHARAAAVIAMTVPGMMLVFDGQFEGKKIRIPVQLGREPFEPVDQTSSAFYNALLEFINDEILDSGQWQLLEVKSAGAQNESFHNLLAWMWTLGNRRKIIVVNFAAVESQARIAMPSLSTNAATIHLNDHMTQQTYDRNVNEIRREGLFVSLNPWGAHWFSCDTGKNSSAPIIKALSIK